MILGRHPNLWLGALTALFNVAVAFRVGGFAPTVDQITIVNVALAAVISLVANSTTLQERAATAARERNARL